MNNVVAISQLMKEILENDTIKAMVKEHGISILKGLGKLLVEHFKPLMVGGFVLGGLAISKDHIPAIIEKLKTNIKIKKDSEVFDFELS
ncbi:hypothetical protein ACTHO0_18860 [Cytobacillus praedii]|uniref:hypothetical protein n=1 Tax=Cytobacillus praedii TaxID=1742358 RepID=UPI003F7F6CF4